MSKRKEKQRSERSERKKEEASGCCAGGGSTMFTHTAKTAKEKQQSFLQQEIGTKIMMTLAIATIALLIFNQIQLSRMDSGTSVKGITLVSAAIVPTGMPEIYGKELGVQYDDVSPNDPKKADATIAQLRRFDETITLQGKDHERYIGIAGQISCEYCCGAGSIIFTKEDEARIEKQVQDAIATGKITAADADKYRRKAGEAACGCAHSYAMRGLAKYLIAQHGAEVTDQQILEELAKWKTLFFPTQMGTKAQVMKEKGIAFSYADLGSNKYRGIEKEASTGGSAGGMVGGC